MTEEAMEVPILSTRQAIMMLIQKMFLEHLRTRYIQEARSEPYIPLSLTTKKRL